MAQEKLVQVDANNFTGERRNEWNAQIKLLSLYNANSLEFLLKRRNTWQR